METLKTDEVVIWVDADAAVVDFDVTLDPRTGKWMYLVRHTTAEGIPNTGVWMLHRAN